MVAGRCTWENAQDPSTVALNSAHMNTNRKHSHFLPISFQATRHTETQNKVQNSVFDVISAILVQRSVEEIRRNKSEIINFSYVTTAHYWA